MAEQGLGEGKIVIPENPYFAMVNVTIQPSTSTQGTGDEEDEEKAKKDSATTSGSFKDEDYIELSSADNNYILEFSTTVSSGQGDENFESDINIAIIDRTGALIDSILGQLYADTVIKYSYGYAYGEMSDEMEATLKGYGSTITPQGERIDISLTTKPLGDQDNSDDNDTGTYSGAQSDIVKQIAEEEGWELGDIEPTTTLYDTTTSTVASEDQKQQHNDFMNDYNTRMKDPAAWFKQKQKEREEAKKKNEFNVNDVLNPENILKKTK